MAHVVTEMEASYQRTIGLLRLALESAEDTERRAHNAAIISPSPAQATVLKQAVAMALSVALMHEKGSHFDLTDVPYGKPLPGSYIEGWHNRKAAKVTS